MIVIDLLVLLFVGDTSKVLFSNFSHKKYKQKAL